MLRKRVGRHYKPFRHGRQRKINHLRRQNRSKLLKTAASCGSRANGAAFAAWATHWFTDMMAGRTDRSQYSPAFAPQVTDEAVAAMARDLNRYGASPLRAEIVNTKKEGDQTFAIVKFVFPRGDATSLLFGFDASGKVTGIAVGGIAGD